MISSLVPSALVIAAVLLCGIAVVAAVWRRRARAARRGRGHAISQNQLLLGASDTDRGGDSGGGGWGGGDSGGGWGDGGGGGDGGSC